MKRAMLDMLAARRAMGDAFVLATDLASGEQAILTADAAQFDGRDLAQEVTRVLRSDRAEILNDDGRELFLNPFNPPLRMVLVGAVHIAQALAPMAQMLGYAVTIVDPRGAFAEQARFMGLRLVAEWPDGFLEREPPDSRTAVVLLTHDPKIDDAALLPALKSRAFYIGALGSRKTHRARIERMHAAGFDAEACARIHGPVGLDIGARTPAEIAVAILAEVTARLRGGDAARRESGG